MTKQELTLVGLSEDKSTLLLVSDSGDEFSVAVDAKLRAALRGESSRPGQVETQMDSALRPRDIQTRIRAGESPESVADAAQTSLDRIMVFAMPVLAERAHVAERAQRASVRRRAGEGPGGVLGDAVAERLRARNVDPESVAWDAWRREDGRWSLTASYSAGESATTAAFVYDAAGRYVVAEDDESRWLVGERVPQQAEAPTGAEPRRLAPVASDVELPLGEDAIELVSDPGPAPAPTPSSVPERTADLTETARTLRAVAPIDELPLGSDHADADWMVTQASERPAPSPRAPAEPAEPEAEPVAEATEEAPAPKKKGRSSMPSWDEIMFGSGGRD